MMTAQELIEKLGELEVNLALHKVPIRIVCGSKSYHLEGPITFNQADGYLWVRAVKGKSLKK